MKKYILLLLFAAVVVGSKAQPPNNPIFFGGSGEGSSANNYFIPAANIFWGSTGDGAGQSTNNAVSNSIFAGGSGDGFGNQSNNAVSNTIFAGGTGDGFSHQANNAVPNNIFRGSAGDGFAHENNNALPNNIFSGGGGDGWHTVLFPMGPLPVKLVSFTAEHAGKKHLVQWITSEEINTRHFEVQRSANGRDFVSIGNINPAGGPATGASYSFTVDDPWAGNNFYRLKIIDTDGSIDYSNTVLLKNDHELQVAVYPNPTAAVLYVRLPVLAGTQSISVVLHDAQGKNVLQTMLKPGSENALNVYALPAGIYTLHGIINQQPFVLRFMKSK